MGGDGPRALGVPGYERLRRRLPPPGAIFSTCLRMGPARVRELLRMGRLQGLGRGWRVKREDLRRFMEEL